MRSECNILASSILECGLRPVFYDLFVDTWHDLETVRPSLLPFQEERTVDQRRKQLGWTELSWGTKILTCNSLVSKENTDGSLVPVPVRILNIVTQTGGRPNLNLADTEANDDVLVRRFMLCDGISGRESGPGGPGEAYLDGTGYLRVLRWAAHLAVQAGPRQDHAKSCSMKILNCNLQHKVKVSFLIERSFCAILGVGRIQWQGPGEARRTRPNICTCPQRRLC